MTSFVTTVGGSASRPTALNPCSVGIRRHFFLRCFRDECNEKGKYVSLFSFDQEPAPGNAFSVHLFLVVDRLTPPSFLMLAARLIQGAWFLSPISQYTTLITLFFLSTAPLLFFRIAPRLKMLFPYRLHF